MDDRAASRDPSDPRGRGIPDRRAWPLARAVVCAPPGTWSASPARWPSPLRSSRSGTTSRRSARGSPTSRSWWRRPPSGGLAPGILASVLGFLTFNFFFLPPYGTWSIGRPEFVVVLFVFLALSVVISELLARATERAESGGASRGGAPDDPGAEPRAHDPGAGRRDVRGRPRDGEGRVRLRRPPRSSSSRPRTTRGLVQEVTVGDAPGSPDATWNPRHARAVPGAAPPVGRRPVPGPRGPEGSRPPRSRRRRAASCGRSAISSP